MGMAAMLVMWPRPFEQLFFPKDPGGCIWNLVAIGPVVSEEKSFEIVDGRRACLYYKLPRSLRLRWAKKKIKLNSPKYNNVCSYEIFPYKLKNEFEKAVVNEPSVFEPLQFQCSYFFGCISTRMRSDVNYLKCI